MSSCAARVGTARLFVLSELVRIWGQALGEAELPLRDSTLDDSAGGNHETPW